MIESATFLAVANPSVGLFTLAFPSASFVIVSVVVEIVTFPFVPTVAFVKVPSVKFNPFAKDTLFALAPLALYVNCV